jgi:hypothetical protein
LVLCTHISWELARRFYQTPQMFDYGEFMQLTTAFVALATPCLVFGFGATKSFAWGQKGHQMINRVAVSMVNHPEAARFLEANKSQISAFASTPDTRWKNGRSADKEKPLHWFEIDGYSKSGLGESIADLMFNHAREQLGADITTKYGMAMWRTSTLYAKLVDALKAKEWTRAIQIGGVMGHYVGDMTQPMHATTDYDGQSINKPGIHKYYETTMVDEIDTEHLYSEVLATAGERRSQLEQTLGNELDNSKLQRAAYTEANDAYDAMDQIRPQFERGNYNDSWLKDDLKPRMAKASALLGKIWEVAFVTSGARGMPAQNLAAKEPEWIPFEGTKDSKYGRN